MEKKIWFSHGPVNYELEIYTEIHHADDGTKIELPEYCELTITLSFGKNVIHVSNETFRYDNMMSIIGWMEAQTQWKKQYFK